MKQRRAASFACSTETPQLTLPVIAILPSIAGTWPETTTRLPAHDVGHVVRDRRHRPRQGDAEFSQLRLDLTRHGLLLREGIERNL